MTSKTVVISSGNPIKVDATANGFQQMFPDNTFMFHSKAVSSLVSAQPMSSIETLAGAQNRQVGLQKLFPVADYWVSLEGGVEIVDGQLESFAWVVIKSKSGLVGKSRTASFYLPDKVSQLIFQGLELGDADDRVFGEKNSKQANGSVGILTRNVLTRATYYEQAVILALIPFKNPGLYTI